MNEPQVSSTWEIRQGDTLIGTLAVYDQDMFWHSARFEPTPAFEPHRALFAEGETIRETDDEKRWTDWQTRVGALGWRLVRLRDGQTADDFMLYISGGAAEFRPRFDADDRPIES